MVWSLFSEARRVVERKIAVDLVCRDVMEAQTMCAACLEQSKCSLDIRLHEGPGQAMELSLWLSAAK